MSGRGSRILQDTEDKKEYHAYFYNFREEVEELFFYIANSPLLLYRILADFTVYKTELSPKVSGVMEYKFKAFQASKKSKNSDCI